MPTAKRTFGMVETVYQLSACRICAARGLLRPDGREEEWSWNAAVEECMCSGPAPSAFVGIMGIVRLVASDRLSKYECRVFQTRTMSVVTSSWVSERIWSSDGDVVGVREEGECLAENAYVLSNKEFLR